MADASRGRDELSASDRGCVRTGASDVDKEYRQERSGLSPDHSDQGLHSEHLDQPL
jgi:hypothetical protein